MTPCPIGQSQSHNARFVRAKCVRPHSKTQRNDFRDAEAIAEAVQRPTMKFVTAKIADQLDLWAPRRVHERLICHRTGIINQIRTFLWSAGLRCAKLRFLRTELPIILATRSVVLLPRMLSRNRRDAPRRLDWEKRAPGV